MQADSVVSTQPIRSLTDLIEGRVSGVQVIPPTGLSGQAPMFRVRGVNIVGQANFDWIVNAVANLAVKKANEPPPRGTYRWDSFLRGN